MTRLDWSDPGHRRWIFVGLGALALVLAGWAIFREKPAKASGPPPVPVTVAVAKRQDIALSLTELGAAQAWTSVNVLAQVSGKLLTVNFTEGTSVKAGDLLAQIDPAPYQAALEQAQGTLQRDRAALANAKLDLARFKRLEALNSIATQQVDTQAALVLQDEGAVQSDKGTVKTAAVNLGWTRVIAPITGRTGVRLVDQGNIVSTSGSVGNAPATAAATNTSSAVPSGGTGIVVVNQIQPIAVTFTVPEGDFQNLAQVSNGFRIPLMTRAYSQETGALLDTGELSIADNRIDPSTGTIELKARLPNARNVLWPGQFVNVQLTLQTLHNVTTIPTTAVNRGPNGSFAYVVQKDGRVAMRPLTLASTQDATAIVAKGVKPGEIVVTDGQMILKDGLLVRDLNLTARPARLVNLASPFIHRPIATTLFAIAVLLIGIVAYSLLPVASLPNVDFPTVQISASLPGASPETMASNVATPLERQFSLIPGVAQMTSVSALGTTSITLQFELGQNLTDDFEQVQAAINAASAQLPTNLPAQPTIRRVNPADAPIMILSLNSDSIPLDQVDNYADVILSQQVSRINGVGLVTIGGQQKPAVRIQLDPRKIAARGLQIDQIRTQIVGATTNAAKGSIIGPQQGLTVYANDQILDASPWNDLVVGYSNGAPVRVRDIGTAYQSVENNQIGAWVYPGKGNSDLTLKGGRSILLVIYKEPGANVIDTVNQIRAALPHLQQAIPPGIAMHILMDRTQTISASVQDVKLTLLITIALVVIVIWLFLLNVRATLIPSSVIPLALLGATVAMLALNFSLDNLSLMALTIAVGFVVDDAIVMVEVIWQQLEHGAKPFDAALAGSRAVSFTVLSISISLVAVFTPLMFMGGVVGLLMREFAVTLSAAVLVSLVLTLTVTPMLCAQFLKSPTPPAHWFTRSLNDGFRRLEKGYAYYLDIVLEHKLLTAIVFLITVAVAIALYATASTGFFPQQDTGFLSGVMLTSQNSSYIKTRRKIQDVASVISQDPGVAGFGMFVGSSSANQANMYIALKPKAEGRTATADQVIARLRPKLAQLIGVRALLQAAQDINVGGRAGQAQYQYTLADPDLNELDAWAPRLLAALQTLPQLKDVSSDQQSNGGAVNLQIDRAAAMRFGISPTAIDTAVYDMLGQDEVTQYFTQQNSYHVVIEGPPGLTATPALFNSIYILSPTTGKSVPLSLFVKVDPNLTSSLTVSHQGEFPAATLSFNLAPGVALGQATQAVEQAQARLGAPPTLTGSFQGTAQAFQQSLSSEPMLILAALIAVYVILGVLYESFVHPLTILSTLPSAGVGALLALKLAGQDLNVIGIIAIILLIGIVKKNGIMIVDVALRLEREHGMSAEESVRQASHQRLRPILMTTACAMLGGIPMILMSGTGSEFRQPLGYAIVGGLLVSQVLTLFTTPVIYIYLDRLRQRLGERDRHSGEPEPAPAE